MRVVAPHAGAWIETRGGLICNEFLQVAPHAGAWIETTPGMGTRQNAMVAPHAGAWIETGTKLCRPTRSYCRPSRRGVD